MRQHFILSSKSPTIASALQCLVTPKILHMQYVYISLLYVKDYKIALPFFFTETMAFKKRQGLVDIFLVSQVWLISCYFVFGRQPPKESTPRLEGQRACLAQQQLWMIHRCIEQEAAPNISSNRVVLKNMNFHAKNLIYHHDNDSVQCRIQFCAENWYHKLNSNHATKNSHQKPPKPPIGGICQKCINETCRGSNSV